MKFIDTIKLSTRALLRQKIRTMLTSFAVFIGIFLIILMVSGTMGGSKILTDQFTSNFDLRNITVLPSGSGFGSFSGPKVQEEEAKPITPAVVKDIEGIDHVIKVQEIITLTGKNLQLEGQEKPLKGIIGAGFDLNSEDQYVKEVKAGEVRDLADDEALITYKVADAYGVDPKDIVGKKISLKNDTSSFLSSKVNDPGKIYEFTVVGVIDVGSQQVNFMTSSKKAALMQAERGGFPTVDDYLTKIGYDELFITTTNENITKDVAKQIRDKGYNATTIEEVLTIFSTITGTIQIVFSMFGIIALIVASIGIINTMIMSVYERTKEIGVMKAIGASKGNIRGLFLTEAAFIGFIGGVLGLVVSLLLMALIEYILVTYVFPAQNLDIKKVFITPLWLMIGPVAFSTFIGMVAGVYPAFRASNLKPVDALRYE